MIFPSPWKLATGGAALLAVVLSAFLMSSYFENRDLMAQRNELTRQINDPKTGFVARMAQAQTNIETLKAAVESQNDAYQRLSNESTARVNGLRAEVLAAQKRERIVTEKLQQFLATKPQGATLEERIADIDRRALSELMP